MTKRFLQKTANEIFGLSLLGVPYLIWLYSIPIELNKRLPKEKRLPKLLFQIPFLYALIYLPIGFIMFVVVIRVPIDSILPFHFGAMFAIFWVMITACISIVRFEKQYKFKRSSSIGLFFGMWYYIFGIWSIQKKLNTYVLSEVIEG